MSITLSRSKGKLGIHRLKEINLAFLAKMGWRLINVPTTLWTSTLGSKYIYAMNVRHGLKIIKNACNL